MRGWLIVGVLDISEVIIFYTLRGSTPARVLQGVAVALLGKDKAVGGGWPTALLGLAMHFTVAFFVVLIYHLLATRLAFLKRQTILCGVIYGLCVFGVMYFGVMPLTKIGWPKLTLIGTINSLFAHLFCIGIPTAWSAREAEAARGVLRTV